MKSETRSKLWRRNVRVVRRRSHGATPCAFIDKEIRPHIDEPETGQLPPYDITRKLLATFGVDAMNRDQLEKELAAQEAGEAKPKSGGGALSSSMALILNMELAGVCLGLVGSMGVSMG